MAMLSLIWEIFVIDGFFQERSEWEYKQVLVKHGGTYVRVHSYYLVPHTEKYQSSSESESIIEPTTSPSGPKETSNISISEENDVEEELGTPSDHVEQHQTVKYEPT